MYACMLKLQSQQYHTPNASYIHNILSYIHIVYTCIYIYIYIYIAQPMLIRERVEHQDFFDLWFPPYLGFWDMGKLLPGTFQDFNFDVLGRSQNNVCRPPL